jgi:hypothetical protein
MIEASCKDEKHVNENRPSEGPICSLFSVLPLRPRRCVLGLLARFSGVQRVGPDSPVFYTMYVTTAYRGTRCSTLESHMRVVSSRPLPLSH